MKEIIENLEPTGSRVVLKQERVKTQGKIILMADSAEKSKFCEVVSIGPDCNSIIPGLEVVADPYTGHVLYEDEEVIYTIVDESDVLAVVFKEE